MVAAAHVPGLDGKSQVTGADGKPAGSSLIGQSFTDAKGNPVKKYFQSRPSNAGTGYDATASGAGNQGPESVVDALDKPSLLTLVCGRSKAVGDLEGVDGSRPYCTDDGVGAVLGVFHEGGTSGRITKVVSLDQACPAQPFLAVYKGVRVNVREARRGPQPCRDRPRAWRRPGEPGRPRRRGHRERQWSRPADQPGVREAPGAARRT
ncbi:potassium-transporting ATPase subunit C [Streptomyces mirabilis]|uniref:potassium-transporting ATPase subunit C n=1 Tax=Streptomyces mirabilis TaxID=68239 RepID=UPI00368A7377